LEKIESLFQRHTQLHHFYLRDMRSGQEWELGTKRPYPIGSCFKLALLMAVFDEMSANEIDRPMLIQPECHVDAVGVIKLFDSAISLTPHQLCQLILTASDATATDLLIERVGLEAVERVLRKHAPDSHISRNLASMMRDFRAMPESATCKQRDWANDNLAGFSDRVAAMGATNARDLAGLIAATWNYEPKSELRDLYRRCLDNRARTMPRTDMFFAAQISTFTKSGSLGYRFFVQDSGILSDNCGNPIAVFGHCSVGWTATQWHVDELCGEIGLHLLDLLGIERPISVNWSAAGSDIIHGNGS
jgi:Beta-lactamase enzyme family